MPKRTVLLVEDNSDNQIIYRRALEHFGYAVIEVERVARRLSNANNGHHDGTPR